MTSEEKLARLVDGGAELAFLSLDDLLRSKETERENDWMDIALLEEMLDSRNLSNVDASGVERVLSSLRSRRGFERALAAGCFKDQAAVQRAAQRCHHPVTFAFLAPLLNRVAVPPTLRAPIESLLLEKLSKVPFGESQHLAIVEVIRRGYKRWAMEIDRLDKQAKINERRTN